RLLETLRSYGEERLDERGETAAIRDAHLAHFLVVAGRTSAELLGSEQFRAAERFSADWDNLRVALEWAVANDNADAAAVLVLSTTSYGGQWFRHEHPTWIEQALTIVSDEHPDRAVLLGALAIGVATSQGDQPRAIGLAEQALR